MPDATDRPTVHDHAVEADPVHDALDGWRSAVTETKACPGCHDCDKRIGQWSGSRCSGTGRVPVENEYGGPGRRGGNAGGDKKRSPLNPAPPSDSRDLARECRELLRGERPVTDLTLAHLRELSTLLALRDPTWRREVEG